MARYQLVCSDIDGTLLDPELRLSIENRETIQQAVDAGIIFAMVSGRFRAGMLFLQRELDITGPLSCFNGAYIEADGKTLYSKPLLFDQIRKADQIIKRRNIQSLIFTLDDWYIENKGYWYEHQIQMSRFAGHVGSFRESLQKLEQSGECPYKLLAKDLDTEKIAKIESELQDTFGEELSIFRSAPTNLEIVHSGIDKANTVTILADYYGIPVANIMAIGDFHNDLGMIQKAGLGIAMGNAVSIVKENAAYITGSNIESGVAAAIKKFILE